MLSAISSICSGDSVFQYVPAIWRQNWRVTSWNSPSSIDSNPIDNGQRIVPRNQQPLSEAETGWMKAIYTQSLRDTPMNRLGTPEEIAAAIGFLGAPEASYITGQVLFVGGGAIG